MLSQLWNTTYIERLINSLTNQYNYKQQCQGPFCLLLTSDTFYTFIWTSFCTFHFKLKKKTTTTCSPALRAAGVVLLCGHRCRRCAAAAIRQMNRSRRIQSTPLSPYWKGSNFSSSRLPPSATSPPARCSPAHPAVSPSPVLWRRTWGGSRETTVRAPRWSTHSKFTCLYSHHAADITCYF